MIDDAVMTDYIREANPVPNLDDLDADELNRSAAITEARRAAAMQAPPQQPAELQPTPPSRRYAARVFAVAFIMVLVGVGIAALVLRPTEVPVGDEPVTETTMAETPTEPSQLESLTWTRIPIDGGMESVTVGGPGLVAVEGAWVWTSPDGIIWTRAPDVLDGDAQSVIAGGPGLVAVGSSEMAVPGGVVSGAGVWTSVDGLTWTQVPGDLHTVAESGGDDPVFRGAVMESVTVGGPGLVAVGSTMGDGGAAVVWTSPDGFTWSRVPYDEAVFGGPGGQLMSSVTAGGPGLVAVGSDHGRGGEGRRTVVGIEELRELQELPGSATTAAAVWTSPDGFTWSRVPHDEAVFGEAVFGGGGQLLMSSVTAGGPGLVAVGRHFDGGASADAAVWTSPDGFSWSRVPHDEEIFGGDAAMSSVTTVGSGLVAVGGDRAAAAVWTSPDGFTWSRVPHDEAVFGSDEFQWLTSVTAGGPGLVAVGASDDGAVWIATPND